MTTREEFAEMVADVVWSMARGGGAEAASCSDAVMVAWDAQAAEVERLRAEVEALRAERAASERLAACITVGVGAKDAEALRTGVPLTAENAPRARVVETQDWPGIWVESLKNQGYWERPMISVPVTTKTLIARGATVLAWRT